VTFVGVCGGREFADAFLVARTLADHVRYGDVVVHGGAPGADTMADRWARRNRRDLIVVPALWDSFEKGAGFRRNAIIAALPLRLLIAFPGGTGTADMVERARSKGIPIVEAKA